MSITSSGTHPTKDGFTVTITFSEPVTGLAANEIEVTKGAGSNFAGAGAVYTLDIAPDAGIEDDVTVTVTAGAVVGPLNNGNLAASAAFAVDTQAPVVSRVAITSNPGPDATYAPGDEMEVTVTFSETVVVTGTPRVTLKVGERDRSANYESLTGAVVVFAYTVAVNDSDTDGVSIEADSLSGGTIRDTARNNAVLTHSAVAADTGQKVDGIKPVLASTDGAVANGTMLTLAYSEPLDTSSAPGNDAFSVTGGNETRTVTGVRVSGSAVELTLDPAAEHEEAGITVSYTPGMNRLRDVAGNEAEALSQEPVTNDTPDTTSPTVSSVEITSNPPDNRDTYATGDVIEATVTFSETVMVTGTPRVTLKVGERDRSANYESVTGAVVVFAYTVAVNDSDTDGVSIEADSLSGGTIRDTARNNAVLTHSAVAADTGQQVDGIKPVLASTDGAVANGTMLTLAYSEPLDPSSVPENDAFSVTGGSETRTVTNVQVSGSAVELTVDPAVEHGETGLRVGYTIPTGTGANPIQDQAGNDADRLSNRSVTNVTGDTTGPTVSTVAITSSAGSDSTYAGDDDIEVTVTFNETVVVTGTPELTLNVGSRDRTAEYQSVSNRAVKFTYRVVTGDNDEDGVSIDADSLSRGGGTIRDGARNNATLDHAAVAADSRHRVDGILPVLANTDGAVVNGTALSLAYSEPLNSSSRPAASAFSVTGGSQTRTVTRVQVSGNSVVLTLNPAVTDTESGLRLNYQAGDNPIEDTVGNAAEELNNEPVTNNTGDTTGPTVQTVRITSNAGSDQTYAMDDLIEVTVTFSETVVVTGTPRVTLKVGERDRSANYESVTGAVVVFAYTVAVNDSDTDGVSIEADSLSGGTIRDTARNNAVLTHSAVAADTGQKVDGIKPVLASTDGAVANGTMLTLAYSEPLDTSSAPGNNAFSVTGGNETRTVTGVRVSGSAAELTLTPAVEHGETGLRVGYTIPTGTGANPIQDQAGNDADRLSNRSVTNVTGDTTGPTVEMVRITSSAGSDSTYAVDDSIEVAVTFNETVVVTGTPRLTLNVGGQNRTAEYLSVSGSTVKFEYKVVLSDRDRDGVSIDANSLSRGSGTIRDGARNDATLTHAAVAPDSRHKVDGVKPSLATTDGAVVNGTTLTLAYSEPLNSSSRPAASAFSVTGGSETRTVTRVQVSGNAVFLTLSPAVQDTESGLRLSYQPGSNPIRDLVGNAADELNNQPVTNKTGDTTEPVVETVRITSNAGSDQTYAVDDLIEVTVTFDETVVVTGTPRLTLNVGGRSRTANYQDVTGAAVRFEYKVVSGDAAPYGVRIEANRLSSGTIRDGAQNNAVLNHAPVAADSSHKVDGVKPVLATSDGTVVNGTTLTLAYGEPLDSSSRPSTDDFTVTGGSETRTVRAVRVDGSAVFLTLSSAVTDGESGLRVNYEPGSNPIQDTAGNDADRLSNKSVTNQTGDTAGPVVSMVAITSSAGSDRIYGVDETIEVTVTFDETVVVTGTPEVTLNVGGRNRTAEYQSVSNRAVKFTYRVVTGDNDEDGVSIEANGLSRSGGTIRDGAQNDATLDHNAVADNSSHQVDAVAPVLALTDPAVVNGATLTLTYNEPLNTSSRPATSDFTVAGGNETRTVTRVQVTGSEVRLTVSPAAEYGETGIRVGYESRSNPIQDAIGNDAEAFRDEFVDNRTPDTTAPSIEGIQISSDSGTDETYAVDDMISVTVTYDEPVTVDTIHGTPTLDLLVGTRRKRASASVGPARAAVVFVYTVEKGDEDEDGLSVPRGSIALNGGKILDLADNPAARSYEAVEAQANQKVDASVPGLQSVTVHGLRVALTYDEALDEDSRPARDDFAVTVEGNDRTVIQVQVRGNSVTLTLTSPVAAGETVRVSYTPGFDPIQDEVGNAVEALTDQRADPPLVTIQAKQGSETVMEGATVEFTLTRGPPTEAALTVSLEVTETRSMIKTSDGYEPPDEVEFRTGHGDVGGVDRR